MVSKRQTLFTQHAELNDAELQVYDSGSRSRKSFYSCSCPIQKYVGYDRTSHNQLNVIRESWFGHGRL